jgi:hypothetical protein
MTLDSRSTKRVRIAINEADRRRLDHLVEVFGDGSRDLFFEVVLDRMERLEATGWEPPRDPDRILPGVSTVDVAPGVLISELLGEVGPQPRVLARGAVDLPLPATTTFYSLRPRRYRARTCPSRVVS